MISLNYFKRLAIKCVSAAYERGRQLGSGRFRRQATEGRSFVLELIFFYVHKLP